jgi:hypothetical protein
VNLDLQHFRALPRVVCQGFSVWLGVASTLNHARGD